jgi:hypothetical protein
MIIGCPAFQAYISNQVYFFGNIVIALIAVNVLVREEVVLKSLLPRISRLY